MWAVVEIQTSRSCFTPTMGSSSASSTPSVGCGKLVDRLPWPPPLRVECWRLIWTSSWARFFFCEVFPYSANQMEFVFRKDLLDMTLANGDERSSWPMRWSWQDEIDEFKILCTFLYKDWILFPGWKDGVSCIMHIRPPHQCQDVLHDQPDIPSPFNNVSINCLCLP